MRVNISRATQALDMSGVGGVIGRALVAAVALVAVGGCAASPLPAPTPSVSQTTAAPTPTLPPGGIFLTDLKFTNAPAGFSIPARTQPMHGYNIPDIIDVIFTGSDGPIVHDYLVANLASMGYTITAMSSDSIVWSNDSWDGAFTMTADRAGLTLRHR